MGKHVTFILILPASRLPAAEALLGYQAKTAVQRNIASDGPGLRTSFTFGLPFTLGPKQS